MRLTVTRDEYFSAAMRILGTQGSGALKIAPLCASLGVSSGSFYNYFGSLDGFVKEFLQFWETDQTQRLIALARESGDARAQVHRLKQLAANEIHHAAEGAIRAWSDSNVEVAAAQLRVDELRLGAMRAIYTDLMTDEDEVELLASMGLSLLVGHQALRPHDDAELSRMFDKYEAVVFDHAARRGARRAG